MKNDSWKLGWKIVRKYKDEDDFTSGSRCGEVYKYSHTEKTKRKDKCGPMCVFEKYEDAKAFLEEYTFLGQLYDCKYQLFPCMYKTSEEEKLYYFCNKTHTTITAHSAFYPTGTSFADEVLLLHWVEGDREKIT